MWKGNQKTFPHVVSVERHFKDFRHVGLYLHRMQRDRIPKLLKNYKPRRRRNRGRPMKRLLDDKAGTGQ
jgi:hypothetical protein